MKEIKGTRNCRKTERFLESMRKKEWHVEKRESAWRGKIKKRWGK